MNDGKLARDKAHMPAVSFHMSKLPSGTKMACRTDRDQKILFSATTMYEIGNRLVMKHIIATLHC
jgi:hypothetical protein